MGRDHVSATVNTLVLAYVGAALPILLLFSAADLGVSEAANLEVVAKEIVATLVGSIGLIAAVPITTGLAALLATARRRKRPSRLMPQLPLPSHAVPRRTFALRPRIATLARKGRRLPFRTNRNERPALRETSRP